MNIIETIADYEEPQPEDTNTNNKAPPPDAPIDTPTNSDPGIYARAPLPSSHEDDVQDRGYGWVVVLGCFLCHVIIGGLERGDGIFFLVFSDKFGKSAQATAWPLALVTAVRFFLGPFAGYVASRYSCRTAVVVGGLLMTAGLFATAFVTDFYFLFLTFVLLDGVGRALCYAPALIIVSMYFNKKRSLAAGLGTSGVGVGNLILVNTMFYAFEFYGFTGAFILLSGISFNMLIVAMLFRPLSMHKRFLRYRNVNESDDRQRDSIGFETSKASSVKETHQKSKCCCKSSCDILFPIENKNNKNIKRKRIIQCHLLKYTPFLLFCSSIGIFTFSFKSSFTFLPALMTSKGLTTKEAATVLSVSGIFDSIGRIGAGIILDSPRIRPHRTFAYNICMFVLSGISLTLPLFSEFIGFSVICCVYSLFTGAMVSQKSVLVVDLLGQANMADSFGLLLVFQGVAQTLGPPVYGLLKDISGGYDQSFMVGGGCMVLASVMMLVAFVKHRRNLKKHEWACKLARCSNK